MTDIKSMTKDELKNLMTELGEKPFRAKQIYSWLHEHLVTSYDEMGNIPGKLKEKLKDYPIAALEMVDEQVSAIDGTRKYLFRLSDGNVIESVLMRYKYFHFHTVAGRKNCRKSRVLGEGNQPSLFDENRIIAKRHIKYETKILSKGG